MAKNRATAIPTFNPNQTLKDIREKSLNPVINRVFSVETAIETEIVPSIKPTYNNVRFDTATSKLYFEKTGKHDPAGALPDTMIDLSSIVPQFAGINVKGYTTSTIHNMSGSGEVKNTSNIKFEDADITKDGADEYANVKYKWDEIVPAFQKDQTVSIPNGTTGPASGPYTALEVVGDGAKEYFTYTSLGGKAGTVRINLPIIPEQQTATIFSKTNMVDKKFTKIKITGNVGGSIIDGDELQIDLPTGGGSGFSVGYFQGFFNSINELDNLSALSLVPSKSSAYVMTEITNVLVYVLYMYMGPTSDPKWKPVTTKPPLIYQSGQGTPNQGIISLKFVEGVTVDDKGELDLSALKNPDNPGGVQSFMGIYNTLDEIKAIVDPVEDKSYAMVRNTINNGFLPYSYRKELTATDPNKVEWYLTPNLGHLMSITGTGTDPQHYKPIYGIKSTQAKVNTNGVLVFPDNPAGTVKVSVSGQGATPTVSGEVRSIRYYNSAASVSLTKNTGLLEIYPAQRVVDQFSQDWKDNHSSDDYLGNLFYNKETGRWMGMTDKNVAQGEEKWTHVFHKGMGKDVEDITYRIPKETPSVVPGGDDEDPRWEYNGITYVEKQDAVLPDDIKEKCGAFIQTDIKESTTHPDDITKKIRIQTCRADDGESGTFMRVYDNTSTETGSRWKKWVRTSYSSNDITAHMADPAAHRVMIKHFRVLALFGKYLEIYEQYEAGSAGGIHAKNVHTLADNYGYSGQLKNYLDTPYSGKFSIGGVYSFSGYKDNEKVFTVGRWQVLIRKRDSATSSNYLPVAQFTYEHTDRSKPYPSLRYRVEDVELQDHQELVANLIFNDQPGLKTNHPDLYIVPTRSYVYIEDSETKAGSYIGNSHRVLYGNLDVIGDVGVKSHHSNISSPSSSIRVYGEVVNKTPVEMTKVNP